MMKKMWHKIRRSAGLQRGTGLQRGADLQRDMGLQGGAGFRRKQGRGLRAGILLSALIFLFSAGTPGILYASETSRSSSGSSGTSDSNSGEYLYRALQAIYGGNSGNQNNSGSSGNSGSNSNSSGNGNAASTTDQLMQRMETEETGPEVRDVNMSEFYHENYKVYEERLTDAYIIYSNIAEGSITNRPVVFDIPKGVGASMKKDGEDVPFASNQRIEGEGSYVLTLYVIDAEEDHTAFREQTVSRARFRFRIQYGTGINGVVGGDSLEEEEPAVDEASRLREFASEETMGTPEEDLSASGETLSPPEEGLQEEGLDLDRGTGEEEEEPASEEISGPMPAVSGVSANEADSSGELGKTDLFCGYEQESGYYRNVLRTGDFFYTNVPNGTLTNEGVLIQDSEGMIYSLFRNGEEVENFTPGEYVQEPGSYSLYISRDDAAFRKAYGDRSPMFHFRILGEPVSDLSVLTAPQGSVFRGVRFNGLDAPDNVFLNDKTLHLEEDGEYQITVEDEAGSRDFSLSIDRTKPYFSVTTAPNLASIQYFTRDVARCVLYRGDELVSDPGIVDQVTNSGDYTLYVYDEAGNMSQASFRVRYRLNAGAVIAILAVAAIIGALVFYMLRIRKKVKVV